MFVLSDKRVNMWIQLIVLALLVELHRCEDCKEGEIRLVGGTNPFEGRVEIYHNGVWGTVCDDGWDMRDARVVCRSLGLPNATRALQNAAFGQGNGQIWLDDVHCQGNENYLTDCTHYGWGRHNCGHHKDASVVCALPRYIWKDNMNNLTGYIGKDNMNNLTGREIRLVGGTNPFEGRVEIYHNGVWGTVCDDLWDIRDARVVCRSLGLRDATSALHSAAFGQGNGQIWLDDVHCQGNENYLTDCTHYGWGRHDCGHSEDASVVCAPPRYKWQDIMQNLTVPCNSTSNTSATAKMAGIIQVSLTPFSADASQLFAYLVTPNSTVVFGRKECKQITFDGLSPDTLHTVRVIAVHMTSTNISVYGCRTWSVKTSNALLRLVGGQTPEEGRVEIYHDGEWGTICNNYWDLNDANVACRSIGLPPATYALHSAVFGRGTGRVWLRNLHCSGNEASLGNCSHSGWGNVWWCNNHYYDAGVVCGTPQVYKFNIANVTGVITSPGYPQYMQRGHYEWTFDKITFLVFEEYNLQWYGQWNGFAAIVNGTGTWLIQLARQSIRSRFSVLIESRNSDKLVYHSPFTYPGASGRGFRLRYFALNGSHQTLPCHNDWNGSATAKTGLIELSWTLLPPGRPQRSSLYGYVAIYNSTAGSRKMAYQRKGSTQIMIDGLRPNTMYTVRVIAVLISSTNIPIYGCMSLSARTSNASLRLVGGQTPEEGRVEIYHDGEWGTVCNNYWDLNDANVACRSIGLPPATYALRRTVFGRGTGRVWLRNLHCSGNEASLGNCSHSGWGNVWWCNNHYYDAGVVCGTPRVYQYNVTNMAGVITNPGYPQHMIKGHFEWTFKPHFVNSILLYFEKCDLVAYYQWNGYVTTEDAFGKELVRVEGQRRDPFGVLIETNQGKLVFRSPFTYSRGGKGFRLRYCAVNGSLYKPSVVSNWNISAASSYFDRVRVIWSPLPAENLHNRVVSCYLITCNSTDPWGGVSYVATSTTTAARLYDLVGYTNYRVQVIALVTGNNKMQTMYGTRELFVRTAEGVPNRSPSNITLHPMGPRAIVVQWDHIPRQYVHGNLLGYKVSYWDYETWTHHFVIVPRNNTQVVLRDLRSFMRYVIHVSGFTAAGEGSRWYGYIYTKCGEHITTNKMVKSPGYPNRIRSSSPACEWIFTAPNKTQLILLMMEDVDLPLSAGCSAFYVAFFNGRGQEVGKFCGRRRPFTLISIGTAKLLFHVRRSGSLGWRGFKARFYTFSSGIENFPIVPNWKISAYSFNSTIINVQWSSYPVMESNSSLRLREYLAVCTPVGDSLNITAMTANRTARQVKVTSLMTYTNYTVQVLAVLDGLNSSSAATNWTENIRGSEKVIVRTGEDAPSQPPGNVRAQATGSHSIMVTWREIPRRAIHGILAGYRVYHRVAWSNLDMTTVSLPSNKMSVHLKGLRFSTRYRIEVAGFTGGGEGPKSRAIFTKTDCARQLPGRTGNFTSPNYPSNYPSNTDCTWTIGEGQKLTNVEVFVVFDVFSTEENPRCSSDYVNITDDRNNLKGKFCGRRTAFAVSVSRRKTIVTLHTDGGLESNGFHAIYLLINETLPEGIELTVTRTYATEAKLSWNKPAMAQNDVKYFVVFRLAETSNTWDVVMSQYILTTLRGLVPARQYEARVVMLTQDRSVLSSRLVKFVAQILPTTPPPEPTASPSPTPTEPIELMYRYGPTARDSLVPNTWEFSWRCMDITLNDDGMQIFNNRYYKLYVCRNGLIRFGSPWYVRWPYTFGSRWWLSDPDLAMLAPYWALSDNYGTFIYPHNSKVYYHVYTQSDNSITTRNILDRATSDVKRLLLNPLPSSFQATWVLVVTWNNLRHSNTISFTQTSTNTFQAVVITDGVYSFVMYNYPSNEIKWSAPTQRNNYRHFQNSRGLPVVGWSAGRDRLGFFNVPRSGTVNIESIDETEGQTVIQETTEEARKLKKFNHGVIGKWFFRLETSTGALRAEQECIRWFKKQPDPRPFIEYLEPCPCTFRQAWWDERFGVKSRWWWADARTCALSEFPSRDGWEQKCCYSNDWRSWGALITGHPGGGSAHRFSSRLKSYDHIHNDVRGFRKCCVESKLCHLYYQKRPSDDCSRYEPPEWSWLWGDPHFVTLDGKNYTFNGLGEYVMVDAIDGFFQLQARTKLAKGEGTATVFSAAVAKERNTSTVQVNLMEKGVFEVLIDGKSMSYDSLSNDSTRLNGSVIVSRPQENAFKVTFPSGISVTTTEVKGALSILLAAPKLFKNQTRGLLGTWNGNSNDDLTTPTGRVLPSDSSSKKIHFEFGQLWQVNSNTTLFTYKPGEGVATFSNTSFIPMFVEDIKFANESLRQQAIDACQGDINCLFDSASTNDVSVGTSTKNFGSKLENESIALKNSPPRIHNDSLVIYLTVNTTASVTVMATDPDGDTMKFNVSGLPESAVILRNTSSITIVWNVTKEQLELEFIVMDTKEAVAVMRPTVYVCACHNDANCFTPSIITAGSALNDTRFGIMSCECTGGYTGRFCESDIDACEVNMSPCYPGVKCIDLPAPANVTGFECGPCPSGFTGNGDKCSDIDECDGSKQRCSQMCANTPGSYTCDCNRGYKLNIDGNTCDDINECLPASDCMQKCENTDGSYTCNCNKYFKVDPANPKNCIPESPCKQGNHGCQHICYVSGGNQKCTCHSGYQLQDDEKSCSDVDECKTGRNRCNQKCNNTVGGYYCSCVDGFSLDKDNVTCVDIDECMKWTFNCSSASLRCQNTIGSYKCKCEQGLYWIESRCRGLEKGEKPPPPPPPSPPRTPSIQDLRNSVNVTIMDLNISQWNKPMDSKFKKAVAGVVTSFCARDNGCVSPSRRKRGSADYITFTEDQIHLLPGFPIQLHTAGNMFAVVALYVKFPPGVAIGRVDTINKFVVIRIVNESIAIISKAINRTIISISMYVVHQPSTTTQIPSTVGSVLLKSSTLYIIIGVSVAGLILIVGVAVFIRRKIKRGVVAPKYVKEDARQEVEMRKRNIGDTSDHEHHSNAFNIDNPAYDMNF